ncbi:MAG: hypothetical protein EXR98_17730 [Gemmataceae bacterium]|nr:hypothetical protein [Gemmataceae bacterium]
MDQKVTFAPPRAPAWPEVVALLASRKFPVQIRMIDGELAFPDETPPHDWRELRIGTPPGMITLRREPDGITLVIWGNAEADMRQAWNAVTWAIAQAVGGVIGTLTLEEFTKTAELPAGFLN